MFKSKHVTHQAHKKPRGVESAHKDKKIFSNTAERTEKINSLASGRPMRGGIRL